MLVKNLCLIFAFAVLSPIFLYAQSADEVAIKRLLENETKDFLIMPLSELVQKYWKLDDHTCLLVTEYDGNIIRMNKDVLLSIKDLAFPAETDVVKAEHFVHINGDFAFASHEQIFVDRKSKLKVFSHEIRVLNKVEGVWKIHVSNVHQYKKG